MFYVSYFFLIKLIVVVVYFSSCFVFSWLPRFYFFGSKS